jgi:hypothetical protein
MALLLAPSALSLAVLRAMSYTIQSTGSTLTASVLADMSLLINHASLRDHSSVELDNTGGHQHTASKVVRVMRKDLMRKDLAGGSSGSDTCVVVTSVRNPFAQLRSVLFRRSPTSESHAREMLHARLAACAGCTQGALDCAFFNKANEHCNFNFWSTSFPWATGADLSNARVAGRLVEDKRVLLRPSPPARPCAIFMSRYEEITQLPKMLCDALRSLEPSVGCVTEPRIRRSAAPQPGRPCDETFENYSQVCESGFEERFDWTHAEIEMISRSEHMLFYSAEERLSFLARLSSRAARHPLFVERLNSTRRILAALQRQRTLWNSSRALPPGGIGEAAFA